MKWGEPWTKEQVDEHLRRFVAKGRAAKAAVDATLRSSNPQSAKRARAKRSNESKSVHPQYRIAVHSRRWRRTDSDGVSIKSAIDGLVRGGLLGDDSPDWIPETPAQSQEKSDVEETVIEVWEIIKE